VKKATIGFAMCGSFCTFSKAFEQMSALVREGYEVIPIMSQNAFTTDTRFGAAEDMVKPFTICAENVSSMTLNGVTYNIVKF
jgi:dipicolinate synthase subunit B